MIINVDCRMRKEEERGLFLEKKDMEWDLFFSLNLARSRNESVTGPSSSSSYCWASIQSIIIIIIIKLWKQRAGGAGRHKCITTTTSSPFLFTCFEFFFFPAHLIWIVKVDHLNKCCSTNRFFIHLELIFIPLKRITLPLHNTFTYIERDEQL